MEKRRYYIDWLRVLAFGILIVFHGARFFDSHPWHLKNIESSTAINYFVEFIHSWRMQLIFFVSGAGTFFAIRSRKEKFVIDRLKRLLVPYVFGIIVLIPPQKYLEALFQSSYQGTFWSFLGQYPDILFGDSIGINLIWIGHLGYHIWYLPYLLVVTMISLPLLNYLRASMPAQHFVSFLTSSANRLFLLTIPLIILEYILRPYYPRYLDWADFAMYSLFFLYGFMFQLHDDFILVVEKRTYLFLAVAIICWAAYLTFRVDLDRVSTPSHSWSYLGTVLLRNINNFSWVVAFLGLSKKFLDFRHALLHDLNQGILPFYILHQTVIMWVGYYIIQWDLPITSKFLIILLLSVMLIMGTYQIIRRTNLLKVLFGMKTKTNPHCEKNFRIK